MVAQLARHLLSIKTTSDQSIGYSNDGESVRWVHELPFPKKLGKEPKIIRPSHGSPKTNNKKALTWVIWMYANYGGRL